MKEQKRNYVSNCAEIEADIEQLFKLNINLKYYQKSQIQFQQKRKKRKNVMNEDKEK